MAVAGATFGEATEVVTNIKPGIAKTLLLGPPRRRLCLGVTLRRFSKPLSGWSTKTCPSSRLKKLKPISRS